MSLTLPPAPCPPLKSGMLASESLEGFQCLVMTRPRVWGEAMQVIGEVGWRTSSLKVRKVKEVSEQDIGRVNTVDVEITNN